MRKQQGFTLIELIIVIVILGILAVTAAPQFINFSSDARAATVKGLEGSVKAASEMVHAKALINTNNSGTVTISGGVDVALTENTQYPAATDAGIIAALDVSDADWDHVTAQAGVTGAAEGDLLIYPASISEDGTGSSACFVFFRAAVDGTPDTRPVVGSVTTGCE